MDDHEAISRARAGNTGAFAVLVERYHRPLLAFIHRIVRDPGLTEDLGQEVFLSAFQNLDRFDERRGVPFAAWLFAMARNRSIDHLRKLARSRRAWVQDLAALPGPEPGPLELVLQKERVVVLDGCLAQVSEPFRSTLADSLDGKTVQEIADARQIPQATVKTRLFRAREKLGHLMRKQFGGGHDEQL